MTTSYTTYQLPISYSEIHIAIIGQEQERNKGLGLRPAGLNSFNAAISASGDTQNMHYLSIGKQQWGLFQTAGKQYNAVLSLPYQDWYSPVIAVRQAATEMIGYTNLELNNFDITLGSGDGSERRGIYFCFGKQQWVFQKMIGIFPIAFSQFVSTGDTAVRTNSSAAWYGSNGQITLSQIKVCFSNYTNIGTYIAVGMQQWGYITLASQGTATLPLPFSDTNYVITTGQQRTSNNGFVQITGRTANNVSFKFEWDSGQNKSGHCWWITCGKQQWGFRPMGSVGLQIIDLLLSTTTNLIAVSGQVSRTASDTNGSQNILYVTSTADTVSFRVVNTENYAEEAMSFFWLLIAVVQQWGYSAFTYGGHKVTFPMPYTVQCYGVVSQNIKTTTQFIVCAINDVDLTGFWDSNGSDLGAYWFAIGRQRIKRRRYHYRDHTTLFLQIVYRHHKYQWRHY